jgi:hypothetical protein
MTTQINSGNFCDFFNLDYAVALVGGISNIDSDSAIVTKLVTWCAERGYDVSRDVALDVLTSLSQSLAESAE